MRIKLFESRNLNLCNSSDHIMEFHRNSVRVNTVMLISLNTTSPLKNSISDTKANTNDKESKMHNCLMYVVYDCLPY